MHEDYNDIRSRIDKDPQWWDECGVPRYDPFAPDMCHNIYADEAALVLIACQDCGREFDVAFTSSDMDRIRHNMILGQDGFGPKLADTIRNGSIHYGDPPNIRCCPAGPTMNCNDLLVLQYWRREAFKEWERDNSLEVMLPDHPEYVRTTEGAA